MEHIEQIFSLVPVFFVNPYLTKFCQMSFIIEVTKLNATKFCNVCEVLVNTHYLKITDGYTEVGEVYGISAFEIWDSKRRGN